eukprot:1128190-Pelagomonas_calceolata.AAC.1
MPGVDGYAGGEGRREARVGLRASNALRTVMPISTPAAAGFSHRNWQHAAPGHQCHKKRNRKAT